MYTFSLNYKHDVYISHRNKYAVKTILPYFKIKHTDYFLPSTVYLSASFILPFITNWTTPLNIDPHSNIENILGINSFELTWYSVYTI